jgi:hypothetical protein
MNRREGQLGKGKTQGEPFSPVEVGQAEELSAALSPLKYAADDYQKRSCQSRA